MVHLLWSIVVGFFIGLVARAILPGADHLGFVTTTIVGIVGSMVGGYVGSMLRKPEPGATFHPAGFAMSVVGAIVLLLAWRMVQ